MAVPSGSILSEKTINTVNIPTVRQLSEGAGAAQGNEGCSDPEAVVLSDMPVSI